MVYHILTMLIQLGVVIDGFRFVGVGTATVTLDSESGQLLVSSVIETTA